MTFDDTSLLHAKEIQGKAEAVRMITTLLQDKLGPDTPVDLTVCENKFMVIRNAGNTLSEKLSVAEKVFLIQLGLVTPFHFERWHFCPIGAFMTQPDAQSAHTARDSNARVRLMTEIVLVMGSIPEDHADDRKAVLIALRQLGYIGVFTDHAITTTPAPEPVTAVDLVSIYVGEGSEYTTFPNEEGVCTLRSAKNLYRMFPDDRLWLQEKQKWTISSNPEQTIYAIDPIGA